MKLTECSPTRNMPLALDTLSFALFPAPIAHTFDRDVVNFCYFGIAFSKQMPPIEFDPLSLTGSFSHMPSQELKNPGSLAYDCARVPKKGKLFLS
jgi:hypothetical protein